MGAKEATLLRRLVATKDLPILPQVVHLTLSKAKEKRSNAEDVAEIIAEDIRVVVAGQKIVRKASRQTLGSVTLSIGVAQFRSGESDDDLIARSDAAMYAAKRAGRNCVQLEDDAIDDGTARRNVRS